MSPELLRSKAHFVALFKLVRPFHKGIAKGVVAGPLIGILSLVPPYLGKLLFDRVAESHEMTLMLVLVAGVVAFSITSALSEAVLNYYSSYLNIKLENTTQLLFFNHLQHLPLSFFYHRKTGEIASRFEEIKAALGSIHAFIKVVFGQGIYLLIVPPFLFLLNWKLALVAVLAVPLSAIVVYWFSGRLRMSWKQVVESHAQVGALQTEMLNQIATIKVMQLEPTFYQKASSQLTGVLGAHMRAQTLTGLLTIFDRTISVLNVGLFTWLGWWLIIRGEMSVGDYVAFTAYVAYLRNPMKELVNLFTKFQQWAIHLDRVFEFLNVTPEQSPQLTHDMAKSNVPQPPRTAFTQGIQIADLSFAYNADKKVLSGVSMEIKAGSMVALIGNSGSGKSTLLRLLAGIERDYQGQILLDEQPINTMDLHQLRSLMGVVWQDVELFQGTLYENLTMGVDEVQPQWLDYVVELCCLSEVLNRLPEGLDTVITARGITLSGGQRQRLALARALLRSAPILMLDEAMSSLDIATETKIVNNLITHAREHGQTIIFVTHRVTMASRADTIYLFEQGQIIAAGQHHRLLESSPEYRQMHNLNKDIALESPSV